MYFEQWKQVSAKKYQLERAYLNIYRRHRDTEDEVFCLHCDPTEAISAPHGKYKRGPHIHVSEAGDPLKKAHIALDVEGVETMLRRQGALHIALESAIQMIRDEVLDLLEE